MRATVTTTTAALLSLPAVTQPGGAYDNADDWRGRSYVIFAPAGTGTVLLKPAATGTVAGSVDMSDAARWDFSKAMLTYVLEPGKSLFAKTASGFVDLDILEGGER